MMDSVALVKCSRCGSGNGSRRTIKFEEIKCACHSPYHFLLFDLCPNCYREFDLSDIYKLENNIHLDNERHSKVIDLLLNSSEATEYDNVSYERRFTTNIKVLHDLDCVLKDIKDSLCLNCVSNKCLLADKSTVGKQLIRCTEFKSKNKAVTDVLNKLLTKEEYAIIETSYQLLGVDMK